MDIKLTTNLNSSTTTNQPRYHPYPPSTSTHSPAFQIIDQVLLKQYREMDSTTNVKNKFRSLSRLSMLWLIDPWDVATTYITDSYPAFLCVLKLITTKTDQSHKTKTTLFTQT